jgi:ribosomal protein L37AE/L43A
MAISELVLAKQQRVITTGTAEYECPGCGRRTRNASGKCRACHQTGSGFDLTGFSIDQLKAMAKNVRAEMERRALELQEALRAG